MKNFSAALFFCFLSIFAFAQQNISLEDIWQKGTFATKSVPGFAFQKDGKYYTVQADNKIKQYDLITGQFSKDIFDASLAKDNPAFKGSFDDYSFSNDESKILLSLDMQQIYRWSYYANYFVWDGKKMTTLFNENPRQRYATFSPKADKIAFVVNNNLYFKDLTTDKIAQITTDGKENQIINGASDWVYEEELELTRAFEWSPDGTKLAFLRFDESQVPEFTMDIYKNGVYPDKMTFKYPKVGEKNAVVTAFIYDLRTGKTIKANTGDALDMYYPRVYWANDAKLLIYRLNRHQNELDVLAANAATGETTVLLKEKNKYYIDVENAAKITFLKDSKKFVWQSDRDGFNHLYLYNLDGTVAQQLTKGNFDVTEFYGVDEKRGEIYYQAAENSPMDRQIYAIGINGKKKRNLTNQKGINTAQFSTTFDYFSNAFSSLNSAPIYAIYDNSGKLVRMMQDNAHLKIVQENFGASPAEFFNFNTTENVNLNGFMIKPQNMDATKKYPVLMFVYGGPGNQQVLDQWKGSNYWWFQMLVQKGYIVACVDNRGTGGRGSEFKKITYQQLGKYETIDQIEAAKYLGTLPYIDAARIGIFGWSYGGYMSSLCILKGADVFKAAIAVAPVTNWKWYDSIYTERYMRTEQENPSGYRDNSPIYFANLLKGNYLLMHGTADDNVHFQNTVEMANALINANKQFDMYIYPNRNHGIYGGYARLHLYTKMTNFLMEKL